MKPVDWFKTLIRHEQPWQDDRPTVTVVVDDRRMLLGLDHLYREAIKPHERGELLRHAEEVAGTLHVPPANVPVEGYYTEHPDLTRYFLLMRALQFERRERTGEVEHLPAFRRLLEVVASPIYGRPLFVRNDVAFLLPLGRDPLGDALERTTDWRVPVLVELAERIARASDDFSLVALAALARDPVVLAALRESVVLYADSFVTGCALPPRYEYRWQVDRDLEGRARRFVDVFNGLFGEHLPSPEAGHAALFAHACDANEIVGRCVRLGQSPEDPPRFYHWAVMRTADGSLAVDEFWDHAVWTTERYRRGREPVDDYRPKWRKTFAGQDPEPLPRAPS